MTRSIIVCKTCRYSAAEKTGPDGRTGGEHMLELLRQLTDQQGQPVEIGAQDCLWACSRHCNVLLRDDRRYSYLAGDFRPEAAQAQAILDWFAAHGCSETGEVAFRLWPDAIRGHFIARIPPADNERGEP